MNPAMPTLLTSLLNVSSSWLGRWSYTVEHAGMSASTARFGPDKQPRDERVDPQWAAGHAALNDRQRVALARSRITEARARLNPVRPSARVVCAPHDNCRTVITGRMGDVCEMLDHLVAREAATMRAHAGTTTLS
jgi:hypothetical protein